MKNYQVLVLNTNYMPIGTIDWKDAVCLWYCEKAKIIASYDTQELHSQFITMKTPAVVLLSQMIHLKRGVKVTQSFTRRNVWERDHRKCQYCGKLVSLGGFTLDHIVPKSIGGPNGFLNIVVSCKDCNSKKGNRTPEEAGMKLIQKPYIPKIADSLDEAILNKLRAIEHIPHSAWKEFFYWDKKKTTV